MLKICLINQLPQTTLSLKPPLLDNNRHGWEEPGRVTHSLIHWSIQEKKQVPFTLTLANGKLATLTLGYLIRVRLREEIPKSLGSFLLTHILQKFSCHFAKGAEYTGMVPALILTVGHSYDYVGSETRDLVSVTQCSQCKVGINTNTHLW